jgi:hypothetical protein
MMTTIAQTREKKTALVFIVTPALVENAPRLIGFVTPND